MSARSMNRNQAPRNSGFQWAHLIGAAACGVVGTLVVQRMGDSSEQAAGSLRSGQALPIECPTCEQCIPCSECEPRTQQECPKCPSLDLGKSEFSHVFDTEPYALGTLPISKYSPSSKWKTLGKAKHHDGVDLEDTTSEGIEKFYKERSKSSMSSWYEPGKLPSRLQHTLKTLRDVVRSSDSVLDLGCGNGLTTRFIREELGVQDIIGSDLSSALLATARERNPDIQFVHHDATTLDLERTFSVISMVDSFEHIPMERYDDMFEVLKRHSKIGTRVFFSIPAPEVQIRIWNEGYAKAQPVDEAVWPSLFTQRLEDAGFSLRFWSYW